MDPIFVTSNKNKLLEVSKRIGRTLDFRTLDIDEIQEVDVEKVAKDKAHRAYEALKVPLIVEDTGLYVNALNGFPGALCKWLEARVGNEGLCRLLDSYDDRSVVAETCICFYNGKDLRVFKGRAAGRIADRPSGGGGFGWDPIFVPEGYDRTFAELGAEVKQRLSHRARAAAKLKDYLDGVE